MSKRKYLLHECLHGVYLVVELFDVVSRSVPEGNNELRKKFNKVAYALGDLYQYIGGL